MWAWYPHIYQRYQKLSHSGQAIPKRHASSNYEDISYTDLNLCIIIRLNNVAIPLFKVNLKERQ